MPSRFDQPHLDISAFGASQPYSGRSTYGATADRIREEHGRRIQNELNAALAAADVLRTQTTDARLNPATGAYLEVELRRGTRADAVALSENEKLITPPEIVPMVSQV